MFETWIVTLLELWLEVAHSHYFSLVKNRACTLFPYFWGDSLLPVVPTDLSWCFQIPAFTSLIQLAYFWGVFFGGSCIQILKVLELVLGDEASAHNLTCEQYFNNSMNPWNLLTIFFGNGCHLCCNYCFDSTKLSWVPRLWNSSVIPSNFEAVNNSGQEVFVIAILHEQVDLKDPILFIKWILIRVKPFFFLANYE